MIFWYVIIWHSLLFAVIEALGVEDRPSCPLLDPPLTIVARLYFKTTVFTPGARVET